MFLFYYELRGLCYLMCFTKIPLFSNTFFHDLFLFLLQHTIPVQQLRTNHFEWIKQQNFILLQNHRTAGNKPSQTAALKTLHVFKSKLFFTTLHREGELWYQQTFYSNICPQTEPPLSSELTALWLLCHQCFTAHRMVGHLSGQTWTCRNWFQTICI